MKAVYRNREGIDKTGGYVKETVLQWSAVRCEAGTLERNDADCHIRQGYPISLCRQDRSI